MAIDTGPYETRRDASSSPAVRAAFAAARESTRRGVLAERGHRILCEAIGAAGVELGAYDHRIIQWLAGMEIESCAVFAGIITRAFEAGKAAAKQDGRGCPPVAQVHAWLAANGWHRQATGPAGSLWDKYPHRAGVPDDDSDEAITRGALERVAAAEGLDLGELVALIVKAAGND